MASRDREAGKGSLPVRALMMSAVISVTASAANAVPIGTFAPPYGTVYGNSASYSQTGGSLSVFDSYEFTLTEEAEVQFGWSASVFGAEDAGVGNSLFIVLGNDPTGDIDSDFITQTSSFGSVGAFLSPGNYRIFFNGGAQGEPDTLLTIDYSFGLNIIPVPMPVALLGSALVGLGVLRARRAEVAA